MSGEMTLDEARRQHSAAKLRLSLHCATIETSLAREDPLVAELNSLSADFDRREQWVEQSIHDLTLLLATNEESDELQREYMTFLSERKRVYYQLQGRLTALIAAAEATTVSGASGGKEGSAITSISRRQPNPDATGQPDSPNGQPSSPSEGAPHPGHVGVVGKQQGEDERSDVMLTPKQQVLLRTHSLTSIGPNTHQKRIKLPPLKR